MNNAVCQSVERLAAIISPARVAANQIVGEGPKITTHTQIPQGPAFHEADRGRHKGNVAAVK